MAGRETASERSPAGGLHRVGGSERGVAEGHQVGEKPEAGHEAEQSPAARARKRGESRRGAGPHGVAHGTMPARGLSDRTVGPLPRHLADLPQHRPGRTGQQDFGGAGAHAQHVVEVVRHAARQLLLPGLPEQQTGANPPSARDLGHFPTGPRAIRSPWRSAARPRCRRRSASRWATPRGGQASRRAVNRLPGRPQKPPQLDIRDNFRGLICYAAPLARPPVERQHRPRAGGVVRGAPACRRHGPSSMITRRLEGMRCLDPRAR